MGRMTVLGSLPVVGLLARIFSDEGEIGDDIVDFAEFRRWVCKKCSLTDSRAFYKFQDCRGRAGDPLYVLLCCNWLAAVRAGLLKSEEILEGVARLHISNDIEFEGETFFATRSDAKERQAKLKSAIPEIPMEIKVEEALEAIYVCCFGQDPIEEEEKEEEEEEEEEGKERKRRRHMRPVPAPSPVQPNSSSSSSPTATAVTSPVATSSTSRRAACVSA